ncbi:MAG: hypothetical protein YHS30scaffold324_2 [Catenulispora phage 69_17]|nr:MAG: hypothetical protein YHS30scaffold324_2 [Catenulispora phage 69_17]
MTEPTVGRIVHYVSYGTPGGEYTQECRAAIVTEVSPESNAKGDHLVGLCVLNPTGLFLNRGVAYDDGAETPGDPNCPNRQSHGDPHRYCSCGWMEGSPTGGTWHWPERI